MKWQHIPLLRSLGSYRAVWDVLCKNYYDGHPFCDSRIIEALLRVFGTGAERLCVHRNDEVIDGLLIIVPAGPGHWQQFLPAQREVALALIPDAQLIDELFDILPAGAWAIDLMSQDPDYAPRGMFDRVSNRSFVARALTMNVDVTSDFDGYWRGRSSNLNKNLRRYYKRATAEYGSVNTVFLTRSDEMLEGVYRYGILESAGWKGKAGTAIHPDNQQGIFYAEVLRQFAETGQAQIVELWLGDRLAASRLVVDGGCMSVILKTTFDESLSHVAPGRLLLKAFLEHAFTEHKHALVEFYTNATSDQLAWATNQRYTRHITFFRYSWLASIYRVYQGLKINRHNSCESNGL